MTSRHNPAYESRAAGKVDSPSQQAERDALIRHANEALQAALDALLDAADDVKDARQHVDELRP
jgi:hypothetical protein